MQENLTKLASQEVISQDQSTHFLSACHIILILVPGLFSVIKFACQICALSVYIESQSHEWIYRDGGRFFKLLFPVLYSRVSVLSSLLRSTNQIKVHCGCIE